MLRSVDTKIPAVAGIFLGVKMKVVSYLLVLVLGSSSAVAQDACSSLSALSDVPILRVFQNHLGWTKESSHYQTCVLEKEQSLRYQESDLIYFSSGSMSDHLYRSKPKGFKTQTEVENKLLTEEKYEQVNANSNDKPVKLEKLQSQDYRSIGILSD